VSTRWPISLLPGLSVIITALACGIGPPEIQVVATSVTLPQATPSADEPVASPLSPATPVIAPNETPVPAPFVERADVYAERTPNGLTLHYADPQSNREIAAVPVPGTNVTLAGEAIFFAGADGGPVRASANGQHIPYAVAAPQIDSAFYEFLISADGSTIVWLQTFAGSESNPTAIWAAWDTRDAILPIYQEDVPPDQALRLVALSEDGETLYFDRRATAGGYSVFPSWMELWSLEVNTGEAIRLPGEPGCGGDFACDGRVSDDGRYLLRTMPPASGEEEPVVVTDISSEEIVARFALQPDDEEATYEAGSPILTPDARQLVYVLAERPAGEEIFRYFLADLTTSDQRLLAESGNTHLRPVRWLDDETLVLTAEPSAFDEWHLSLDTGELRRVSDRLYLGRVALP